MGSWKFHVIILLQFCTAFVASDYYIRTSSTAWRPNNPPCQLATPPVYYTKNGPTVQLPDINIAENGTLLVGYTQTFEVFENIGCALEMDITGDAINVIHKTEKDPGQCYSACNTTYIGMQKSTCYCFNDMIVNHTVGKTNCLSSCTRPDGVPCGRTMNRHQVSIYKHVDYEDTGDDDDKHCLAVNENVFKWKSCDSKRKGLCIEDGTKIGRTKESYPWINYLDSCYSRKEFPVASNTSSSWSGTYWVGSFKGFVITHAPESSGEQHRYLGYITRQKYHTYLRFTKTPWIGQALCVRDESTTIETTVSMTTVATTNEAGGVTDQLTDKNSAPIAAIVAVPVAVLITGIAVLLLIKWRRYQSGDYCISKH